MSLLRRGAGLGVEVLKQVEERGTGDQSSQFGSSGILHFVQRTVQTFDQECKRFRDPARAELAYGPGGCTSGSIRVESIDHDACTTSSAESCRISVATPAGRPALRISPPNR